MVNKCVSASCCTRVWRGAAGRWEETPSPSPLSALPCRLALEPGSAPEVRAGAGRPRSRPCLSVSLSSASPPPSAHRLVWAEVQVAASEQRAARRVRGLPRVGLPSPPQTCTELVVLLTRSSGGASALLRTCPRWDRFSVSSFGIDATCSSFRTVATSWVPPLGPQGSTGIRPCCCPVAGFEPPSPVPAVARNFSGLCPEKPRPTGNHCPPPRSSCTLGCPQTCPPHVQANRPPHTRAHTRACTHTRAHTRMHVHTNTRARTNIHTCTHARTHSFHSAGGSGPPALTACSPCPLSATLTPPSRWEALPPVFRL